MAVSTSAAMAGQLAFRGSMERTFIRKSGSADPMFPIEHGEALAGEIPGARLLRLEGAGHGVDGADREVVVDAILGHT
jgi:hypothetical protein